MKSVKCPSCGLINFSAAVQCKRCQQDMTDLSSAIPKISNNTPAESYRAFQIPPPPPVFHRDQNQPKQTHNDALNCVKCGNRNDLNFQRFNKVYIHPLLVATAIAPLLFLILLSFFKVTHKLNAPFCSECWSRFKNGKIAEISGGILAFVLAIGSLPVFIFFDSIIGFTVCFISAIIAFVIGHSYKESTSPKFKEVTKQHVVILSSSGGEIYFPR